MTEEDVKDLATNGQFDGRPIRGTIEETHISWVLLTRNRALKIKKPFKLPFLDFSTLRLRKKYCDRELKLNQRFSHIYLSVLPIVKSNQDWRIGGRGKPIDYAVVMKRMDQAMKMDNLLKSSKVSENRIKRLAVTIARFHARSRGVFKPFNLAVARETFNDIDMIKTVVKNNLGRRYINLISLTKEWSDSFLQEHQKRFQERVDAGFKRDIHGDLHSGNIFLYPKPVLFDCIEFNDEYRQIDVLYEIAFLCMELEFYKEKSISDYLLQKYLSRFPCLESSEDEKLLTYYKCLRANVRAKVHGLQLRQVRAPEKRRRQLADLKKYLDLMKRYIQ
ncbi:MAG: hypothetical protein HYR67_02270 [Bacteroidetes bacterium]|nr:hypothetical protein [Bacteroidota bacterium]